MKFKNLLMETVDGVATLTVNRPQSLNALNNEKAKSKETRDTPVYLVRKMGECP
jgi:1,4-dihydroxy-2-naphthoyl-CoA synthase